MNIHAIKATEWREGKMEIEKESASQAGRVCEWNP